MTGTINRVLLVEDNPGDALLLREALKDLAGAVPFELAHVGRLEDALRSVKVEIFDAVLLDLSLPDAHGVETVARMLESAPRLPIVILTGLDDDAAALEAVRAGAQDYLVKGRIDGRLLVRALSYAIERKRHEDALRAANRELAMGAGGQEVSTIATCHGSGRYGPVAASRWWGGGLLVSGVLSLLPVEYKQRAASCAGVSRFRVRCPRAVL